LYGEPSDRVLALSGDAQDIRAGEHAALWPLLALIVLMGVLSPWWMRAIDQAVGAPLNHGVVATSNIAASGGN